MDFQEAQQNFFNKYGFYPSDDVIQDFLAEEEYEEDRQTRFSFQPTRYDYDEGASELLSEFRDSFRGIKSAAKKTYENQRSSLDERPYVNEALFLTLIFVSKLFLYMILRKAKDQNLEIADF